MSATGADYGVIVKPYIHSVSSAKKWGGKPEDYQKIHDWFDSTKMLIADVRHRAILHSAFGIYLAEQVFGINITNSDGRLVSVRDIGEQHVIEDLGHIPSAEQWLQHIPLENWMAGRAKAKISTTAETRTIYFD